MSSVAFTSNGVLYLPSLMLLKVSGLFWHSGSPHTWDHGCLRAHPRIHNCDEQYKRVRDAVQYVDQQESSGPTLGMRNVLHTEFWMASSIPQSSPYAESLLHFLSALWPPDYGP
jgi:hypothetical protein